MSYAYNDRDNLIIKYLPLVKKVVSRIDVKDHILDNDDLVSIGVIGLMDAMDKYDSNKNVPFEAYATLRIRGTVIDEMRKSGKVSRDKIDKLNQYYHAKEELENRLMRTPNELEICEKMGINDKQLFKIHETVHYLANYSLESALFTQDGDDFTLMDVLRDDSEDLPLDKIIKDERRHILIKAIDKLKDREKTILNLYYVEELSLKEIAYILDISIPRVSQIHGKVLIKLKDIIQKLMGEDDV
ncbi:FliA/WhiG family RNA polymerase sigma factor [Tissierella sp. Yu-01]|uniref:sigma-70 family RNA polymerase sigma factor n=1 Tax=Tissierella sp. Yu-01 TaxID=3035694 RepID=UPI00240D52CF|nr:FliA/WhiG family RNA polymerase sigma factor [Tissierella sp. Yu-01]WFA07879.1 FliA/WhiG family RNA polymerase sigma factor [Tissierella sp. Yu-01]